MFVLAGHEVAHKRYPHHTEHHSSWWGELLNKAAAPFSGRLNELTQELSGRKTSPLVRGLQFSFEELLN